MAYHDKLAENKNFYHFEHRDVFAHPHFHSAAEVLFVEQGELSVTIDGQKRILRRGDACFAAGFSIHSYDHIKGNNLCYVLLCPQKYTTRLFELFDQKIPPTFFHFSDFSILEDLLRLCNKAYNNENLRQKLFEGCIQILYTLIATNNPFVVRKPNTQLSLVCEILKFANENLSSDLSLKTLAKRFGYTREGLSRLLHKHLSESWNSYINRLRVQRVDIFLKEDPNRSVLDIAFACGFNSSNTFYRAYLKEFGKAPRNKTVNI